MLYVFGGTKISIKRLNCCEVYDVRKGTWSNGNSLSYAVDSPAVITDQNGTFALVIGRKGRKTKMIIFGEGNGFQKEIMLSLLRVVSPLSIFYNISDT